MFNGDRVKSAIYIANLVIGAAVLTAAFWISLSYFLAYQEKQSRDTDTASRHNLEVSQQGPESCRPIVDEGGVFDWLTCIAKAVSAESGVEQAKKDLQAQQDMAAWALGMLIVTYWLTVITLLGVLFVWRTLIAARDTVDATKEVGRDQSRAYVDVDAVFLKWGGPMMKNPKFTLVVRNSGATPAKWYQIKSDYLTSAHADGSSDIPNSFSTLKITSEFSRKWSGIASGEDGLTVKGPVVRDQRDIKQCLYEHKTISPDRAVPTHSVYVFGVVRYCTAFDEIYTSEFCFGANFLTPFESTDPVKTTVNDGPIHITREEWSEIPQKLSRWPMEMEVYKAEVGQD